MGYGTVMFLLLTNGKTNFKPLFQAVGIHTYMYVHTYLPFVIQWVEGGTVLQ